MSALTEKVAQEHAIWASWRGYVLCACDEEFGHLRYHAEHVAEVTEAAVRAAVAADIDTYIEGITEPWSDRMSHYLGGMYDASRIAEGKQP